MGNRVKKHSNLFNKKPLVENVKVDLKAMVDAHEQLSKGKPIDQKIVSSLLLAGVVNILNQHDTIVTLEEEMRTNIIENVTMNFSPL